MSETYRMSVRRSEIDEIVRRARYAYTELYRQSGVDPADHGAFVVAPDLWERLLIESRDPGTLVGMVMGQAGAFDPDNIRMFGIPVREDRGLPDGAIRLRFEIAV